MNNIDSLEELKEHKEFSSRVAILTKKMGEITKMNNLTKILTHFYENKGLFP